MLIGCGPTPASSAAQAIAPIAASPIAAAPSPSAKSEPAIVASEPEPIPETATLTDPYNAEWQSLRSQPCDNMDKKKEDVLYRICVENTGRTGGGDARIISASSSSMESGSGVEYWFAENGKVNAIAFYHTGEVFMFNPENGVLAVSIISPTEVESEFNNEMRDRLEAQAREGAAFIFAEFEGEGG
ncbi:MAG: hypothetical protein HC781_22220 [Leptolyngbyaceae cyanobacterium CSU_1_4]|nr:hypothetical protein [Leptolyngbyaceae cyanobacterium CSU_1_4]